MPPDDPDPRLDALEQQVGKLNERVRASEHDAAAARILAGAADRDIHEIRSELRGLRGEVHDLRGELRGEIRDVRGEFRAFRRATTASFNALREDMNDRFNQVDNGFIEMRGKFDATAAGQQRIVELLEGLIVGQG